MMVSVFYLTENFVFLMFMSNVFVMKYDCSLSGGFTPMHAAVLSHNAVVKELRSLENPCSYMAMELVQRRQMFDECIKTLLLMGASFGTRVTSNYWRAFD